MLLFKFKSVELADFLSKIVYNIQYSNKWDQVTGYLYWK